MLNIVFGIAFIAVLLIVFIVLSMIVPDRKSGADEYDERQSLYIGIAGKRAFIMMTVSVLVYFLIGYCFDVRIFAPDMSGVFFAVMSLTYYSCQCVWYGAYGGYRKTVRMVYYVVYFIVFVFTAGVFVFNIARGNGSDYLTADGLISAGIIPVLIGFNMGAISITKFATVYRDRRADNN